MTSRHVLVPTFLKHFLDEEPNSYLKWCKVDDAFEYWQYRCLKIVEKWMHYYTLLFAFFLKSLMYQSFYGLHVLIFLFCTTSIFTISYYDTLHDIQWNCRLQLAVTQNRKTTFFVIKKSDFGFALCISITNLRFCNVAILCYSATNLSDPV